MNKFSSLCCLALLHSSLTGPQLTDAGSKLCQSRFSCFSSNPCVPTPSGRLVTLDQLLPKTWWLLVWKNDMEEGPDTSTLSLLCSFCSDLPWQAWHVFYKRQLECQCKWHPIPADIQIWSLTSYLTTWGLYVPTWKEYEQNSFLFLQV